MVNFPSFTNLTFNDSGLIKYFPFGFLNRTNQTFVTMFKGNNSAVPYNNCIIQSPEPVLNNATLEVVLLFKGLMVTRIIPSIYIFIILLSLPLNGLAMMTFTCKIQAKKPAVIYMSHLACVDLLFTLLLPLKIHYQLNGSDWVFGEAACRFLTVAYYCNMYCSILLMMCMSVDRLLAVAFPVTSLTWRSARKATFICILVWLLALAGTVPLLSMKQTFRFQNLGVTCFDWFEVDSIMLYLSVFTILPCIFYFLPLIVILVSYSTIIYVLCAKRGHSVTSSSSSDNRRRAAIMVTAVLIEFLVCFAPSNVFLLYDCVCIAMGNCEFDTYLAYLMAVCFGSSSVFLDPLLYYYGSTQYRQQILSVFWGRKAKRADIPSNTSTHTNPI